MIKSKLKLKAVTLLTVGWGVPEVLGADVVQVKKLVGDRLEPYLPGSSVKGSLRSAASRVAEGYGFTSCGEVEPSRISKAHESMNGPCDVCKVFGWPNGEAALSVGNFKLTGSTKSLVLTRVSLDDRTQTAAREALYSTEHLPPGTVFEGEIRFLESRANLLPLLLLALAELRTGRFGRRSLVDVKLEDEGVFDKFVAGEWKELLEELREWLWEGVVRP
ncbi:MAG: RAMP superfamily CRISPR-associated protein [Thermofilaceae archaeon]|nr:RAMP superfamily CRISPR-associated protein [Thermofilaceae archaeon]